jgi:hypothetical protein
LHQADLSFTRVYGLRQERNMANSKHKCPLCGGDMEEIKKIKLSKPISTPRVWDLGKTGSGVTTTSTSSDSISDVTATTLPAQPDFRTVDLVPYRCRKCGHQMSFRE